MFGQKRLGDRAKGRVFGHGLISRSPTLESPVKRMAQKRRIGSNRKSERALETKADVGVSVRPVGD